MATASSKATAGGGILSSGVSMVGCPAPEACFVVLFRLAQAVSRSAPNCENEAPKLTPAF